LGEGVERIIRIQAPKGAACDSPARKCRVHVGMGNESRRDGTPFSRTLFSAAIKPH